MFNPTYSVIKISGIVALCGFIMGMDVSSLAIFLGKPHFNEYFNHPTPLEQGLVTSASPLGGLIGCPLYGMLVGKHGRVALFRAGSVLWIMGSVIGVCVIQLWMVILSRWVKGLAAGLFSILLAAYIGEIMPKNRKGKTMAFVQLAYSLSILIVYYMCIGLNFLESHMAFRLAWGFEMIPAIFLLILSIWLPESPEWLTLHGQYSKAEEIQNNLARVYNKRCKTHKVQLLNKLELACVYGDRSDGFSYKDLLRKECWRQTLMGSTLQLLVQFSGINILMYYIIFICDMIGLEGRVRFFSASIPYIINVSLSLLPIVFLDYVRRKDITLAGAFPLSVIMLSIGVIMAVNGHRVEPINGNKSLVWSVDRGAGPVVLGLCFLFVAIFALTLSSGPWIYTNEILPTRAKPKGLAVCMSVGWLSNFILTLIGPIMMAYLKWGTFILLGGVTLGLGIIILIFFPDTKDLTKEEIDCLYVNSNADSKNDLSARKNKKKSAKKASEYGNSLSPITMINDESTIDQQGTAKLSTESCPGIYYDT